MVVWSHPSAHTVMVSLDAALVLMRAAKAAARTLLGMLKISKFGIWPSVAVPCPIVIVALARSKTEIATRNAPLI